MLRVVLELQAITVRVADVGAGCPGSVSACGLGDSVAKHII